jgi:hypothetical protein
MYTKVKISCYSDMSFRGLILFEYSHVHGRDLSLRNIFGGEEGMVGFGLAAGVGAGGG